MSKDQNSLGTPVTASSLTELEEGGMAAENEADRARAHLALKQMPPRTRQVFMASQVDGLRYAQIARREHMTLGQVHRHMRRAIRIIAKYMM